MKHTNSYLVAIIPAKTDSTRLKKKNLQIINGKTLLEHTIDYALNSNYVKKIIVSTESDEVRKICHKYNKNILVFERPDHLLKDAEVADVYVDIFQKQLERYNEMEILNKSTHIVALQPDHPDRNVTIDQLFDYFIDNTYMDLVTVDENGTRNGATRIVRAEYVKSGMMSRRVGTFQDNCTNIHSTEDLKRAGNNLMENKYE